MDLVVFKIKLYLSKIFLRIFCVFVCNDFLLTANTNYSENLLLTIFQNILVNNYIDRSSFCCHSSTMHHHKGMCNHIHMVYGIYRFLLMLGRGNQQNSSLTNIWRTVKRQYVAENFIKHTRKFQRNSCKADKGAYIHTPIYSPLKIPASY